jgi:hypothetical protein
MTGFLPPANAFCRIRSAFVAPDVARMSLPARNSTQVVFTRNADKLALRPWQQNRNDLESLLLVANSAMDKDPIDALIGIVQAIPARPRDLKGGCPLVNLAQRCLSSTNNSASG